MSLLSIKSEVTFYFNSTLNSYSLIFFSKDKWFAILLIFVTFFSPLLGLFALLAVLITNILALKFGFNKLEIEQGIYGFNAVFLGLVLAYDYQFSIIFLLFFITSLFILLLITSWLNGILTKINLPFLSFPFLLTYWIVSLSSSNLTNLQLDSQHIYLNSELLKDQTFHLFNVLYFFDMINLYPVLSIYFKTLASTFFQTHILTGIVIAIGLLFFSRIVFTLSIIGFISAYFFYTLFGANVGDLNFYLQGSNFIFLSIGIGCFYLIPNKNSYLTVIILTPVLMLLLISLTKILSIFNLKPFTLSFCLLCNAFLYSLNQRWLNNFIHVVSIQYYSAEKTIYNYLIAVNRYKNDHFAKINFPFWGEWFISQGHDGDVTHLGEWNKALDFIIVDSAKQSYSREGLIKEDYFCFNKPILAPSDGYVYDIINIVEDNEIGDNNTDQNWGNSIILNHLGGLYSQISHIKKDSFKVNIGDYVKQGSILASCGNSGRSSEPHIHFQLQTLPVLGAKTLSYPIAYYLEHSKSKIELHISKIPKEKTSVSNVILTPLLVESFSFQPGQILLFRASKSSEIIKWEVYTNAANQLYFYCKKSESFAYFINDGTMFYFTDFVGNKGSLLFKFYLAAYKILLGYYESIRIEDEIPLNYFNSPVSQFFQDFLAPFYLYSRTYYYSNVFSTDHQYLAQKIVLESSVITKIRNKRSKEIKFELSLENKQLKSLTITYKNEKEIYLCT